LLNAKTTFFFSYSISWQEQVTFSEIMMMSTLYKTNTHSWIFIELSHWNNSAQR